MSIWFMHDDHTFKRLDTMTEDAAMDYCEQWSEKEGCGFIGCKAEHGNQVVQWRRGKPWREQARELLRTAVTVRPVSAEVINKKGREVAAQLAAENRLAGLTDDERQFLSGQQWDSAPVPPHYVTTQSEFPVHCPECGEWMRRIGDYEFACGTPVTVNDGAKS